MDIIGLIKNALLALVVYLQLKSKAFVYDINQKSKAKQKELIDEIEKLRASNSSDDNDRADILRDDLLEERIYLQHISAVYSLSAQG
jgi:hypothetical protein